MRAECSERGFRIEELGRREIVGRFDGGRISSDGGAVLLAEVERRSRIVERFAACFRDHRDPARVEHTARELVMQRVLGLCLGYEDLSDHEHLRADPLLAALSGKPDPNAPLAGKSTLSRLELSTEASAPSDRYKRLALDTDAADRLFTEVFLDAHAEPPNSIVIDLDATDFPIHGRQEGRFFHGYYDRYCYLPLYIFAGEHLLGARLRRSNIDGAAGSLDELRRIVEQIRSRWPQVAITIRADSGFCREEIMTWCESERVDFVLGLARNDRLVGMAERYLAQAQCLCAAACMKSQRVYAELEYRTLDTWSRSRRVVLRAEHSAQGDKTRFP